MRILKRVQRLGKKAKEYMDQGLLVPDELVVDLVVDRVKQDDCKMVMYWIGSENNSQAEALTRRWQHSGRRWTMRLMWMYRMRTSYRE